MSLIVQELAYRHPDREPLFGSLDFSIPEGKKIALLGPNGSGKSTLLRLLAGQLKPAGGTITASETPYYIPQHFGQYDTLSVAEALGVARKLAALQAILGGGTSENLYAELQDDWNLESRCREALAQWKLSGLPFDRPMSTLSGGEKTRVFLSGLHIHRPGLVLMDEPTNHLDREARHRLYRWIGAFPGSLLIVSHDRTLLSRLDTLYELGPHGITVYGGNYEFYKQQKKIALDALQQRVSETEKSLRRARQAAQETAERKQRQDNRGEGHMRQSGLPRIMMNTLRNRAEKSASKLSDVHNAKIGSIRKDLESLRGQLPAIAEIKTDLGTSVLSGEKIILEARALNHTYGNGTPLWKEPLDISVRRGERIVLRGPNGSGKSTLLGLLLGTMQPSEGSVRSAVAHALYLDQEYSVLDDTLSVYEQTERFNHNNHPEHFLKTVLHRFLFPADSWAKACARLSGGEKMRLTFACLQISDQSPELLVLDEPTNNLDIPSLEIITAAVASYRGTLLVVSHDDYFLQETGVDREIDLGAAVP